MATRPPWKLAIIGMVAMIAGVALLLVDWTMAELAVFVAMFFVARGALHIVTMSFTGLVGALSALLGGGEVGVGVVLLAWPTPTLLVLVVVVGAWVVVCGIVEATIVLATLADHRRWQMRFVSVLVETALGAVLIARPGGTVKGAAITLGVLAFLQGIIDISTAISQQRDQHRLRQPTRARPGAAMS